MNALGVVLFFVVAIPIAWFASEFQERRWLRLSLGLAAIALSFGVAYVVGSLERLNSNAWFGSASKSLVDTTVTQLEAGKVDRVLQAFKAFQETYAPTYENRARFDKLVEEAVAKMERPDSKAPKN